MRKIGMLWVVALVWAFGGVAQVAGAAEQPGYKVLTKKAAFGDVEFDLKDAIVNRGLVIDYTGYVGKMLARTSGAVAGKDAESPYLHARYYQFCSAKLTHDAVSADPLNISICPYVVFLIELKSEPGVIRVGYRRPFAGASAESHKAVAKVEALLNDVITEAAK